MRARLGTILATLLPGEPPWLSGEVIVDAGAADMASDDLRVLLDALPPDFAPGDEAALHQVEVAHPLVFERLVAAAYLAYYTDPSVRVVLEQVTGYEARPPQPLGYELPPFDEALLEQQKQRAPFWRDPEAAS